MVSLLADEKAALAAAFATWLLVRLGDAGVRDEADRMLLSVLIAGAVPHLFKLVVRRRRPDRTLVGPRRNGIPKSGNAWDAFPSGHAMHMGAMAPSAARLSPERLRPLVWSAFAALSMTRILLLAHYPSDVFAGWTGGVLINRAVAAVYGSRRLRPP
jgi:undecaprenyl-diphosphatase